MCQSGNHIVGMIARKFIRETEWSAAIDQFARVVDDFNVRGQRDQIPHPGFAEHFKFCPGCGAPLASVKLRTFADALTDVESEHMAQKR